MRLAIRPGELTCEIQVNLGRFACGALFCTAGVDSGKMLRNTLLRTAAAVLLVPVSAWGAGSWGQLKAGMTRSEAVAVLGTELVASKGGGFEVAIYDGRAEVVFLRGQVVAWTAPVSSEAAPAPPDAWQFDQVSRLRARGQPPIRTAEPRATNVRPAAILPAYRL